MSTSDRQELLRSAVAFLQDPKFQSSPFTQRIQFLEAKGLTAAEIDEAIRQATSNRSRTTSYYEPSAVYSMMGPPPAVWDWRDYFITAVISGSLMYGAVTLARKFVLPHLRPPTSTAYEGDRDALTAQFDAAEALLKEIQADTVAVRQAVEEQATKVEQVTKDVEDAVKEMRDGETKNRDEMREIRDEINTIRESLPRMAEKTKEAQNQSLAELQQELKSLKALLMSRGPTFPSSPSPAPLAGRPSIPAWQLAATSSSQVDAGGSSSTAVSSPPAS